MLNSNATINFKLALPLNFDDDRDLLFLNQHSDYSFKNLSLNFFKNIRVSNNCVAYNYFNIIKESCATEEIFNNYNQSWKFYFKYCFPQFNFTNKKIILFTNEYFTNYFHWHEMLQKIILLQQQNLLSDSLILLPKKYRNYSFIVESLKILGIKDQQILTINKKSNLKVKELIFPCATGINPDLINQLREGLTLGVKANLNTNLLTAKSQFQERIYISRQGQKLRSIENEVEVVDLLEQFGFKKIIMENYSYHQQIEICMNARFIIGPHGAGLTNILFMKKNGYLLELSAKNNEDFFQGFYVLANMLGQNYLYQKCQIAKNSIATDSHHSNLFVDLERLKRNIQIMLNHANI